MPINTYHPEYSKRIVDWQDCRLFYEGEQAVKAQGTRFIPKPECATDKEYDSYVQRAFFFPAMERTVSGLSGAIDRKAPTIILPKNIEYLQENADNNNTTLRQFSKIALDEVFITGRFGLLVERSLDGGKPYLTLYRAEDIINWMENKEQGLELVVLREYYYGASTTDPYLQTQKTRYRVLKLEDGNYVQEVYEANSDGTIAGALIETIHPSKAGISLDKIPFVFCNIRSTKSSVDKPPLLDLANKNAEHLRVSADYANSLYFTGNPILWACVPNARMSAAGNPADATVPNFKIAIGSSRAILLPENGKIGLLECSGHGVNPNRERANDIKLEMAVIGARLLENQRIGVEAAETALIRQSSETSTMSNIVVNCSASIQRALELAAEWEGNKDTDVLFQLNNDFVETTMNPQLLLALRELVAGEYISWDTFYYNLAIGELTVPGRTSEEERDIIDTQPPMGSAAKAAAMGWQVNDPDIDERYAQDLAERSGVDNDSLSESHVDRRNYYYRRRGTSY